MGLPTLGKERGFSHLTLYPVCANDIHIKPSEMRVRQNEASRLPGSAAWIGDRLAQVTKAAPSEPWGLLVRVLHAPCLSLHAHTQRSTSVQVTDPTSSLSPCETEEEAGGRHRGLGAAFAGCAGLTAHPCWEEPAAAGSRGWGWTVGSEQVTPGCCTSPASHQVTGGPTANMLEPQSEQPERPAQDAGFPSWSSVTTSGIRGLVGRGGAEGPTCHRPAGAESTQQRWACQTFAGVN